MGFAICGLVFSASKWFPHGKNLCWTIFQISNSELRDDRIYVVEAAALLIVG